MGNIIVLIILLILFAFCIRMIIFTSRIKKQTKINNTKKINELNSKIDGDFFHFNGLPIPEKTHIHLYLSDDKISLEANGQRFNIENKKIISLNIKTDEEIQKAYTSSMGGAIGGALLFGPVGAIIGGRTKEKNIKNKTTYLIITYEKEDLTDYIVLDVNNNKLKAIKLVQAFENNNAIKEINL